MRNTYLILALTLLCSCQCWGAEDKAPETIPVRIRLREGSGIHIFSHYNIQYELKETKPSELGLTNQSGSISQARYSRLLGREDIPYGVSCKLTATKQEDSKVELETIISVLGPPVQRLEEGIVFANQSLLVPLSMTPGRTVRIDLPREWFVLSYNQEMLKTKDKPIWLELTIEP